MLALVVESNKVAREGLVRHLQAAQYRVIPAVDATAAQACLRSDRPDVVVIAWNSAAPGLIQKIRSTDGAKHCFVLVMLDGQPSGEIPKLYAAGADDFARPPVSREELVGRLDAPRRLSAWLGAGATLDWSESFDLRKLQAWRNMGQVIAEDFSPLVGDLEVSACAELNGQAQAATIPLSLAKEQTELRVTVAVEAQCVRALGELLLGSGDSSEAALDDMIRELANTAGGAVKRAALHEQVSLTTGLPVNAVRPVRRAGDNTCLWAAVLNGAPVRIGLFGEITSLKNRRVPAAFLQEGMVLAQDLRNPLGALVLSAGTRLTTTSAERIVGQLGSHFSVEVTCAE